jgi:hypothetical protein
MKSKYRDELKLHGGPGDKEEAAQATPAAEQGETGDGVAAD